MRSTASVIRWASLVVLAGCGAKPHVAAHADASPGKTCGAPLPISHPAAAVPLIQAAHAGTVTDSALSTDGYLATYSQFDHTIRIWDVARQMLVTQLQQEAQFAWDDTAHALVLFGRGKQAHDFVNDDLLIAPDGRELGTRHGSLASSAIDGTRTLVHAYNTTDKGITFTDGAGKVHHLEKPPKTYMFDHQTVINGGRELAAGNGSSIVYWPLDQEPAKAVVRAYKNTGDRLVFAPTGDAITIQEKDSFVWEVQLVPHDLARPPRVLATLDSFSEPTLATTGAQIAISTPELLVVVDPAGKLLWKDESPGWRSKDLKTRDRVPVPGFGDILIDGPRLIIDLDDGSIALRELTTGKPLGALGHPVHQPEVVAWLDPTHVVAVDQGRAAVWDVTKGTVVGAYNESRGFLGAAIGTDGDLLVARMTNCFSTKIGERATTIAWVDRWSGAAPPTELVEGKAPALRAGCDATQPLAWPPPRGIGKAPVELGGVGQGYDVRSGNSLAYSTKAFASAYDAVRLADGTLVKLDGFRPGGGDVVLRGTTVAAHVTTKDHHEAVGVWRGSDGKHLHDFTVTTHHASLDEDVTAGWLLGMSDDGSRIAVTDSGHVSIFDVESGAELKTIVLKWNWPKAVAFGKDPKDVWIAQENGTIHHLAPDGTDTTVGADIATRVIKIALSPDGNRLVAVGGDGGLRIVDAKTGVVAATLVEFADDEPIAFTPAGAYDGTAEAADRVAWRFAAPVELFRFEQFAAGFHKPELVRSRLAGQTTEVETGLVRPPRVELAPPAPSVKTDEVELAIKVSTDRRVDAVRAYREGREVASVTPCSGSAEVKLRVPLLAGTNTITVQAFDDLGYASNPAVARVARTEGPRPDLYIVSIGVGTYPRLEEKFQLGLATADARGVASAFDGAAGKQFGSVHKALLLDEHASVKAILDALDGLSAMRADDLAIIFLAGHGIKPAPDADMMFVTGNSSLDLASLQQNGIAWTAISQRLARVKGRVILLLDACHSGHLSQDLVVPNDKLALALASEGRAGVVVFAAAKGRQESLEPNGTARGFAVKATVKPLLATGDHGLFTGALLAALVDKQTDRDGDGVVELSEWFAATTDRVTRVSEGLQTPWVARQEMFGDFAVAPAESR